METTLERITKMVQNADSGYKLIANDILDDCIMPEVLKHLDKVSKEIRYTLTLDSPSSDYPEGIYVALWVGIRPVVLKELKARIPKAWFLEMYMTPEEVVKTRFPEALCEKAGNKYFIRKNKDAQIGDGAMIGSGNTESLAWHSAQQSIITDDAN